MHTNSSYRTAGRDEFAVMIEPTRYAQRSRDFEEIIARTEEHFWNPADPDYIDFTRPWAVDEPLVPYDFVIESHTAAWDRLDEGQRVAFANETLRWFVSNLLHGEQGALNLSASLCGIFLDPGAQEYAANQAREEARHVQAFTRYVHARFGGNVYAVGDTIGRVLSALVESRVVHEKIVGMQMLIEGVAMGAFTTLYKQARDPVLRRLCQLVMTDEAFHHRFGKIWAHGAVPAMDEAERHQVEDWASELFQNLLFNLINPEQKRAIYDRFGLEWQWVQGAVLEVLTDDKRREQLAESTNIFRTLTKTLLKAGIITERTRESYAAWVDMDGLCSEADRMVGEDLADAGIEALREINAGKRKIVRRQSP